jgi:fumarate reductase subunit C
MKRKIVKQLLRLVATYFAIETAFGLLSLFQTPKEEVAMGVIATNPNIIIIILFCVSTNLLIKGNGFCVGY